MLEEIQAAIEGNATSPLATDTYWERRLADLPHDSGVRNRLENMAVDLDRGIYIMLKMLHEYGAISADEANEFYAWARDGIYEPESGAGRGTEADRAAGAPVGGSDSSRAVGG